MGNERMGVSGSTENTNFDPVVYAREKAICILGDDADEARICALVDSMLGYAGLEDRLPQAPVLDLDEERQRVEKETELDRAG